MHAVEMPVLLLGHSPGRKVTVQVVKDGVSTYIHDGSLRMLPMSMHMVASQIKVMTKRNPKLRKGILLSLAFPFSGTFRTMMGGWAHSSLDHFVLSLLSPS